MSPVWFLFDFFTSVWWMKISNQTYSPVLALMRDVSGETHVDWWASVCVLARSCNSSSRRCRKASHRTCVTWPQSVKTKHSFKGPDDFIFVSNSLPVAGSHAELLPKQHSWRSHTTKFLLLLHFIRIVSCFLNEINKYTGGWLLDNQKSLSRFWPFQGSFKVWSLRPP